MKTAVKWNNEWGVLSLLFSHFTFKKKYPIFVNIETDYIRRRISPSSVCTPKLKEKIAL